MKNIDNTTNNESIPNTGKNIIINNIIYPQNNNEKSKNELIEFIKNNFLRVLVVFSI